MGHDACCAELIASLARLKDIHCYRACLLNTRCGHCSFLLNSYRACRSITAVNPVYMQSLLLQRMLV